MGVKQEDIDRAIANGNKFMAQLKQVCPKPGETLADRYQIGTVKKKRIMQASGDGLNQTERRALIYLRQRYPEHLIRSHSLKLKLANGCWYTPDFEGHRNSVMLYAWEVKGPWMTDDAVVKLKVAAKEWPMIQFVLLWEERGSWEEQPILS